MTYEILDEDDYFDQAEACYTVCVLWHGGQSSLLYELQCRIDFKPGHSWSESYVEENNEYFSKFEEWARNGEDDKLEKFVQELEHYVENKDD